jgi:nucleoid DNA-binding protein
MDIAKYIGLFLLKNNFCYVHGLGNMELTKVKATHDGTALLAPTYVVIVTPGGSIDDNLANFIATNEQISISKAANALREFSVNARKEMGLGKEVAIPNIGKFTEQGGKVKFTTDETFRFTPAGIPTIKNSKQLDEQNSKLSHKPSYPPPSRADSVNWSMVILVIVLLVILGGGGYGVYYYMNINKATVVVPAPVKDTVAEARMVPAHDTLPAINDTINAPAPAAVVAADTNATSPYRIVIGNYNTRERADRRVKMLLANGNKVETVQKDTASFLVVTTINCRSVDTMHVEDSLRRLFGYKGVTTFHQ